MTVKYFVAACLLALPVAIASVPAPAEAKPRPEVTCHWVKKTTWFHGKKRVHWVKKCVVHKYHWKKH